MSRPKSRKRKPKSVEQTPVENEFFSLSLSRPELIHLRDLLSVVLPPDGASTVSELLAELNGSQSDSSLWSKVWNACAVANIELDNDAPNFVVGPAAPQELGVFQFEQEEER